jgi:hypothetical protein
MVIAAAVATAVAAATGATDPLFNLSVHGRDETSVEVFGNLANLIPLHVRVPDVDRPLEVLDTVRDAVIDTAPYGSTPWPQINRVVGMDRPDGLGASIVTLNFVPQFSVSSPSDLDGSTESGAESGLWVDVTTLTSGGYCLAVKYDPTRYDADGVEAFWDDVVRRWDALLSAA